MTTKNRQSVRLQSLSLRFRYRSRRNAGDTRRRLFDVDNVFRKSDLSYRFTDVDFPGALRTWAWGINDSGQIVGTYGTTASSGFRGFLLSNGTWTTVDFPGAAMTFATAISSNGQIVGVYFDAPDCSNCYGFEHPFLLSGGVYTALPEPPGSMPGTTQPWGINSSGQITGHYVDPCFCNDHGFLLSGGAFTVIDDPAFPTSEAYGINRTFAVGPIFGLN